MVHQGERLRRAPQCRRPVGERIASGRLCSDAIVAVVQTADLWRRDDASGRRWHYRPRARRVLAQREMRARVQVVRDPLRQDTPQMVFVERDHPIETLASSGPDESLAVPVGLRRADGCLQHAQRHSVQPIVNRGREDAVAIVHEDAIGAIDRKAISELLDGLAA